MKPVIAVFWTAAMLVGLQQGVSSSDSAVDLSNRNLNSVSQDLPSTVEYLDLSNNHIQQLHRGDFTQTSLLRSLNMSLNRLEEIDQETFLDTPLLEVLDLSHNSLSCQHYLLHTKNLQVLNLTSNQFLTMTLGHEFSSLVNLERLALEAKNICRDDFRNMAAVNLQTLALSLEDNVGYEAESLKYVHAKKLQIIFSQGRSINQGLLSDALSFFVEVELVNLRDGYADIRSVLTNTVDIHTSHLSVTKFVISWKDITDTVNVLLSSSIAHFSVSGVTLFNLPQDDTYVIETSRMKSFTMRDVKEASPMYSREAILNFFINLPVESLSLKDRLIHMTCPQTQSRLLHLDFSYCALPDSIFSRVENQQIIECETFINVRSLNLVGNNLKSLNAISERLKHMTSLIDLDLSLNSLIHDGLERCFWPPNITNMTLSSNGLTGSVFQCLPEGTQILDLQNNQISVIPSSINQLSNLTSLNLNLNRLRDLPGCNSFPFISTLLLKSNSLHAPTVSKLESCPKLKNLDASLNPFTCTCSLRSFISLGIKSEQRSQTGIELLGWPLDYICTYPEVVRDSTLKEISIPEVSCNTGLLAATILCPAVLLIIGVLTLCHYLDVPWYIGMIWKWTKAKHRARRRQVRPEDLEGVEFHAFVSFSQHDAGWVYNSLLPNLEGSSGLRICHHEKHFVPGKTIVENIITCVEKSRRSLFVLSAHFVKSEWCHYELYFASHQRLAQGSESVVLVLLEPLPHYLIPSKYAQLKSMMGLHTYLEWPQDKAKHRLFWANLRAALQADLPNAPAPELEE
ncbi:toll-like receptor 6 [Cheilinus undulatus]|uniref:toll-like receptor 6 n=1 Tax=Cheilinus undulatus TaxID=241271 RepID=UPI001BD6944E|nr:toll-like receptor 6 [Cheilinus undulatus]